MRRDEPPAGFVRFSIDDSEIVCAPQIADAVRSALDHNTLYDYARHYAGARPLAGRGVAYAVPLPGGVERVVIRHNRHGGLLAPITGDLFVAPTRAPVELTLSEELRRRDVPTPQFLGYATYAAIPGFRRADVMTREVPNSADLAEALMSDDADERQHALAATARLLHALARAAARHADLNVKNVLLERRVGASLQALVLDVDRVTFAAAGSNVTAPNLARLLRSARKWQTNHGARVTGAELAAFAALVRGTPLLPVSTLS